MRKLLLTVSILALAACGQQETVDEKANRIAQETIITDGHIDVPYRLQESWIDVTKATDGGDFDHPRAVKGGLNAPFMSIYTPADLGDSQAATDHAIRMIEIVEKIVQVAPKKFTIARNPAEVKAAFKAGKIALPLGMENGSPINGSMETLQEFYNRGIRYITLAHSKTNHISDSSYDSNKPLDGISEFGEKLIKRMNELGIMVDISHVSDAAFYDVMEVTKVPVIASHSSVRHFTPGFERNMNDDMIKRLAENGGIIMINYGSSFVTEEANKFRAKGTAAYQAMLKETGQEDSPELQKSFGEKWGKENPYPFADISDVLDHIDHVVKLTGSVDYIGIGSDYDGVGDSLPTGLKDVTSYPNLVKGLLERGYSESDIKKILSGNLMRVWQAAEDYAATMKKAS